jgi:hypothetical protein
MVEICSSVLHVLHTAMTVKFDEQGEVHIRNHDHFRVGRGFGLDAIHGEGEVGGGQYGRLGELKVHIGYFGQIPHISGDGHKTLVFDGPGLGTEPYPVVGILGIGEEGDK